MVSFFSCTQNKALNQKIVNLPLDFNLTNSRISCVGNSLTYGQYSIDEYKYPQQLRELLNPYNPIVDNLGAGGKATPYFIDNYYSNMIWRLATADTNILIFWEMGNDLAKTGDTAGVRSRTRDYCINAVYSGYVVGVINLTPRNQNPLPHYPTVSDYNNALQESNKWLESNWRYFSHFHIDIASDSRMQDFNDAFYFPDGVHLSDAGNTIVAEKCRDKLVML